ncbi:MAG: hypothetical protein KY469_05655 [Actinobacteria bacterium]|nr:hypothetical protein [Actinomycetota bacterium]
MSLEAFTELFREAVADDAVEELIAHERVIDADVHAFPAAERPADPGERLRHLQRLRAALADLTDRPDLDGTGQARFVEAPAPHHDNDLILDLALDLATPEWSPRTVAALARFGLHHNALGGVDPDPVYTHQRLLVVVHTPDAGAHAYRVVLSCPPSCAHAHLPLSDLRASIESVRRRIFHEQLHEALLANLV